MPSTDHGRNALRSPRDTQVPRPALPRQIRRALVPLLVWLSLLPASSGFAVTFRWSDGVSSGKPPRIYIEGAGSAMLSDVKAAVPNAPLAQVAPGVWHLRAELQIADGASLA